LQPDRIPTDQPDNRNPNRYDVGCLFVRRPLGRHDATLALRDGTGTPREMSLQRSLALAEYPINFEFYQCRR